MYRWSTWSAGCNGSIAVGEWVSESHRGDLGLVLTWARYPKLTPPGTAIPNWAYQDVTKSDLFNVTEAKALVNVNGPSLQSSASPSPPQSPVSTELTITRTSTVMVYQTISETTTSTSFPSPGHSTHMGAIIGGTVGGVAGLILVVLAILWWRRRSSPTLEYHSKYPEGKEATRRQTFVISPFTEQQEIETPRVMSIIPAPKGQFYVSLRSWYSQPPVNSLIERSQTFPLTLPRVLFSPSMSNFKLGILLNVNSAGIHW